MPIHIYTIFVYQTKVFDTVNRDKLWKIMRKFCCPERFTQVVRQLHDYMTVRITNSCTASKAFAVIDGVKHGCVHAPTLFSLMSAALLMNAYRGEHPGILIVHRIDDNLSNCQHMRVPACLSTTTVRDLFADEFALSIATEADIQRSMDLLVAGCAKFGLTTSAGKRWSCVSRHPTLNTTSLASLSMAPKSKLWIISPL
ncbi:hypothetical protein SprV_0501998400 [Sparganum proliferum]